MGPLLRLDNSGGTLKNVALAAIGAMVESGDEYVYDWNKKK